MLMKETNSVFNAAQITQIFTSAQDLDASLTAEQFSQHDVEMTFSEFNEAIAAMAVFRDPNPYTRLSAKVEHFLTREFYPPLNVRIKRLPPLIPLG
jgi:hypothetical protein